MFKIPYFTRDGILGDRAILVYIAICLVRQPLLAVAFTYWCIVPCLQWFAAATKWSPATVFTVTSTLVHESIFSFFLVWTNLADHFSFLQEYKIPRTQRQVAPEKLRSWVKLQTLFIHLVVQPVTLYWLFITFTPKTAAEDAFNVALFSSTTTHNKTNNNSTAITPPRGIGGPLDPLTPFTISPFDLFKFFFQLNLMNELATYIIHRSFHADFWYSITHKHHHLFTGAEVLGGEHASWIEHAIGTQLTVMTYCGRNSEHQAMWLAWVAWKVWETCELHCGFNLGKTLLGQIGLLNGFRAFYHDRHHSSEVNGNYGSLMVIDYFCGTMDEFMRNTRKPSSSSVDAAKKEKSKKEKVK